MPKRRSMSISRALGAKALVATLALVACDEEVDPLETAEQISQDHSEINVALVQGQPETLPTVASQRRILTKSGILPSGCSLDSCSEDSCEEGDWSLGCVSISPAAVPVEYGAYDSALEDRITVVLDVAERYAGQVDYGELVVQLGQDGETLDSILMDQDPLESSRFYSYLKPSCNVELRDSSGVCILDTAVTCALDSAALDSWEDEAAATLVRCDQFSVRLWRILPEEDATEAESTPTESATP